MLGVLPRVDIPHLGDEVMEGYMTLPPNVLWQLPQGTAGETNGLSMSRIFDEHGTMKQDLGFCFETCLTLLNITVKGAQKGKFSERKRVRGSTSETFHSFASVQIVITERDKC